MSSRREKIIQRLAEMGIEPKRSLGQNFLTSDRVVERILKAAKLKPYSCLLEVGPGLGALTEDLLLLEPKMPFKLIELDKNFAAFWRAGDSLEVFEGDALRLNWADLHLPEGTLLVSNLPYQISSSLVIERSVENYGITRMILMFQKEVAQRLTAKAKSKEYGLLTVIAQIFWNIENLLEAAPGEFYPSPQIASRVLIFEALKGADDFDKKLFLRFVKASFAQRRKLLSKNILDGYFHSKEKAAILEETFTRLGLKLQCRAEELDPALFLRLYKELHG